MVDKFMYIPTDDTQNYPFCRSNLAVETFEHSTNQNLLKPPTLVSQQIRKRFYKIFGQMW